MRDYAKIAPQFWTGETGRWLRKQGVECQLLALYLITCPTAHPLGLFYLPLPTICHETGLTQEGASKALRRVSEGGFCRYDDESEVVWIPEMGKFQFGEHIKPKDNRAVFIRKEVEILRKTTFYDLLYDRYAKAFCFEDASPLQAPSKPLASPFEAKSTNTNTSKSTSFSEPNGSGADAPPDHDPVKELWDRGVLALGGNGRGEMSVRGVIGKARRDFGDLAVMAAISAVEAERPSDPIPWFLASCKTARAGPKQQRPVRESDDDILAKHFRAAGIPETPAKTPQ